MGEAKSDYETILEILKKAKYPAPLSCNLSYKDNSYHKAIDIQALTVDYKVHLQFDSTGEFKGWD